MYVSVITNMNSQCIVKWNSETFCKLWYGSQETRRLKSPVQQLAKVNVNNTEISKFRIAGSLSGETIGDPWFPVTMVKKGKQTVFPCCHFTTWWIWFTQSLSHKQMYNINLPLSVPAPTLPTISYFLMLVITWAAMILSIAMNIVFNW